MIENLKLVLKEDVLATYELDGKESKLPLEAIRKYWDYANEADLEGAKLYTDDNNVVALLATASDQGGVVVIWDAASEEITHISDASYTVAVDIYEGKVFTLSFIQSFGTPLTAKMFIEPVGTMDAFKEADEDRNFEFEELSDYDGDASDVSLTVDADNYIINIKDKEFVVNR
ncbi:MAG: hypothetical protein IJ661_00600 [Lachnospiraceae bacterium]|nr:hypothetical protein [Lachnospiraceae bacterium]